MHHSSIMLKIFSLYNLWNYQEYKIVNFILDSIIKSQLKCLDRQKDFNALEGA